jgi:hypothetical protein
MKMMTGGAALGGGDNKPMGMSSVSGGYASTGTMGNGTSSYGTSSYGTSSYGTSGYNSAMGNGTGYGSGSSMGLSTGYGSSSGGSAFTTGMGGGGAYGSMGSGGYGTMGGAGYGGMGTDYADNYGGGKMGGFAGGFQNMGMNRYWYRVFLIASINNLTKTRRNPSIRIRIKASSDNCLKVDNKKIKNFLHDNIGRFIATIHTINYYVFAHILR